VAEKVNNTLASQTYRLINEVFLVGDDIDRQLFTNFGLTVRQYHLLAWLNVRDQAGLTELATLLLCDKSNVTGIVRRLEAAGLIEKVASVDRRFTMVRLTETGRTIQQAAQVVLEQSITDRFKNVPELEHEQIQNLLLNFASHLRTYLSTTDLKSIKKVSAVPHVSLVADE
jgi:DNA-binding MarR family transcriptional regulator